jgi:sugar (pentulose or hexulose) kinase
MGQLVCGIDLGTSYFKVALFDRHGECRGLGRLATPVHITGPIRELSADDFRASLAGALQQALTQAQASPADIAAVSYASQANTFIVLDGDDQPLTPLILWNDTRAEIDPHLADLFARDDFLAVTGLGLPAGSGFAAMKLRWLQRTHPDIWARARSVMTISDYLLWTLTGRRVGDAGTASLLGLWQLETMAWWDDALGAAGLEGIQLNAPQPVGSTVGTVTEQAAARLPLPAGATVAAGSLDHHVAAIGAGLGGTASMSESTGTVLAALANLDRYAPKPGCVMGPALGGGFYQLAFDARGASMLEAWQKTHAPDVSIGDLVDQAAQVPAGGGGLLAELDAHADDGLGRLAGKAHPSEPRIVRAILEAVAAGLLELVDTLTDCRPGQIVATGGGARSDLWLQIKADLIGCEIIRTGVDEPAALGAAMLAATAIGWFDTPHDAIAAWAKAADVFRPDPAGRDVYADWLTRREELFGRTTGPG